MLVLDADRSAAVEVFFSQLNEDAVQQQSQQPQ